MLSSRVGVVLTILLLAACRSVPFPEYTVLEDESARHAMHARLVEYALSPNTIHRAALSIRGEELIVTLLMELEAPDSFKLAAVTDLGVTLFSATRNAEGMEIHQVGPGMPERFLRDYLIPDLAAGCLTPTLNDCELVQLEGESRALHYRLSSDDVLLHDDPASGPIRLERGRAGRSWAVLNKSVGSNVGAGSTALSIVNQDGLYRARIEIAAWGSGH